MSDLDISRGDARKYRLKRVGAGSGVAIFECENLLGQDVEVVCAAEYSRVILALQRIARGRPDGSYAQIVARAALESCDPCFQSIKEVKQ